MGFLCMQRFAVARQDVGQTGQHIGRHLPEMTEGIMIPALNAPTGGPFCNSVYGAWDGDPQIKFQRQQTYLVPEENRTEFPSGNQISP